ncbi:MAG: hypothetical protein A3I09_03170 [Deltaproteobacteria bacterium RIFCSPLOWO2_02_FULL_47_10]|nr:MAG: hypothetical protein A3I09_03170 [Deltaproteobacteria bacterium RIFCSPLOWO2_02_FULL_47_10]
MNKKVYIATFGCKTNQADSEGIAARFMATGHERVYGANAADICIVNTCTVTAKADAQSKNEIRRLHRANPDAKIIVTGCYASVAQDELKKMAEVDEVMKYDDLPNSHFSKGGRGGFKTRPNLKIQDGCDRYCAYCIVPYARGRARSMPMDEVLAEVAAFKEAGYPEIVLTGIHLGGYGLDLEPKTSLINLLHLLAVLTGRDFRIRLSSIDPDEWTDELINFVTENKSVCQHFHIPLQSGDDEILKKMGRRYTTGQYKKLVSDLKLKVSGCAIGADVIVGFPGETKESFERTRKFIEDLPTDYLHVFPYSERRLTAAAKLKETVSNKEKQERVGILREFSRRKREVFYKMHVNKELTVVIERRRDKKTGLLKGISGNHIPVLIKGSDELMGKMIMRRIYEIDRR